MNQVLPPEEKFWQRYSRHHELPGSTVVSTLLHLGVLGLLLFAALPWRDKDETSVPIDIVAYDDGGQSGKDSEPLKGVHPSGDVTGVVAPRLDQPGIVDANQPPIVTPPPQPVVKLPDENGDIVTKNRNVMQPLPRLAPVLKGSAKGTATTGTGAKGDGAGTKGAKLDVREKRQIRWTMLFRTTDARDYVRQLQALGAILGVQQKDQSISLIKDLSRRPVQLESAQRHPDRIFWMDDSPQSVAGMAAELQLPNVPWRVIAYFPESLEKQLLDKELAYGRSFGRNSEEAIRETKFEISFRGGQARIQVVEQK